MAHVLAVLSEQGPRLGIDLVFQAQLIQNDRFKVEGHALLLLEYARTLCEAFHYLLAYVRDERSRDQHPSCSYLSEVV